MKNRDDWGSRERELEDLRVERARIRHTRRVRNQVVAYITVAVFLAVVGVFAYIGGLRLVNIIAERRIASEMAAEAEAAEVTVAETEAVPEEAAPTVIETPGNVTEEEEPARTEEELLDGFIDTVIADMPLKDKVAGLFLVTPEQLTGADAVIKAGDGTEEALQNYAVGGLVYAQKNIKSAEQISEMLQTTANLSKYPLFFATSEPGGDAGDLTRALSLEEVAAPAVLAESGNATAAYEAGEALAKRLISAGFGVNLAPSFNLTTESMSDKERSASFGSDPTAASQVLAEEVRGLEENGVHTLVRIFPTSADAADGNIPSTEATMEELQEGDFRMLTAAVDAGTRMVTVGNLAAPQIAGDNTPCSLSQTVITDLLRGRLGFDGVVVTDALDDAVITDYYTADQAAVAAIRAGADMIYRPENLTEALDGVVDAVNSGILAESRIDESLKRIYRIKYADRF